MWLDAQMLGILHHGELFFRSVCMCCLDEGLGSSSYLFAASHSFELLTFSSFSGYLLGGLSSRFCRVSPLISGVL